ncbi:hypothetical protein GX50_04395 [[Emmonsia] crescens]|uniref:Zn(2)-C6 fungal-type domain-containing protein n=1 Tax=[Emmonsia] crescens TaxID=73230 RepID=A0A2B7Z8Q2_9EURO|nr:hypothetical protein GX50_04395 [Emmonsia crescens]
MGRDGLRQIRSACDRCHLQKLRCERQQGEESCLRCTRTDASCIYSVRQRRTVLRPPRHRSKQQRVNRNDDEDGDGGGSGGLSCQVEDPFGSAVVEDSTLLDWTGPGNTNSASFDLAFSEWPEMHQLPQGISVQECDAFSLPNLDNSLVESIMTPPNQALMMPTPRSSGQTLKDWSQNMPGTVEDRPNMTVQHVRKLADLNVKLCEHAAKLPPVSTKFCDIQISLANRVFEIDETFCLIQSLIDVINAIYSHILSSGKQQPEETSSYPSFPPSSTLLFSQNNQKDQPSIHHMNKTAPSTPKSHVPDRATFLLILSCYDRVMDIYQCLFTHIECCIQHFATPMKSEAQATQLPELIIGSYKPPMESAVAMKMFLFHTMARQLFMQLQTVLGAHEPQTTGAGRTGGGMHRNGHGDGHGTNNNSNGDEMGPFMDDSHQGGNIPGGYYEGVEDTPPDLTDKNRHDILSRACGMSQQVTSIGKMLMDMSIMS